MRPTGKRRGPTREVRHLSPVPQGGPVASHKLSQAMRQAEAYYYYYYYYYYHRVYTVTFAPEVRVQRRGGKDHASIRRHFPVRPSVESEMRRVVADRTPPSMPMRHQAVRCDK